MVENVVIMGAAGRDFHNFNIYFRDNHRYRVVAFTAAQIPDIEGRCYPAELAGKNYPGGIPIHPEEKLPALIRAHKIDLVAFSYSDVSHMDVMHKASRVMAEGADFILIGATYTMLRSKKPVIAVCAVRTGCGKSQTTRKICEVLQGAGKRVVVVRHPMPYGDLVKQRVQRYADYADFAKNNCTIEEREEFEPLVDMGITVFAGIEYAEILKAAEAEADVIVWDGGNNDTPFYHPDVHVVLVDPHRPGHERTYFPGETNLLMAGIVVVNKIDSAPPDGLKTVCENIRRTTPGAEIVLAESEITPDTPQQIRGKRVLVVEDGPTLTHGGMSFGAGTIAAKRFSAAEIVDPHRFAVGSIRDTLSANPHIGPLLPAAGYSQTQMRELETTINSVPCDLVLFATPIDLPRLMTVDKPALRIRYAYRDHGEPTLAGVLTRRLSDLKTGAENSPS